MLFRISTGCQKDRKTGRQTYRQTDRKTERLFSLVVKTKVVQNVNRMSKTQGRQAGRYTVRQTDRVTERQTGLIAGQLKSPLLIEKKEVWKWPKKQ